MHPSLLIIKMKRAEQVPPGSRERVGERWPKQCIPVSKCKNNKIKK
jgi:hypothetical protein